jgi:hypothetical protein
MLSYNIINSKRRIMPDNNGIDHAALAEERRRRQEE